MKGRRTRPDALRVARFWMRVEPASRPNGCWLWTGFINRKGYGGAVGGQIGARSHAALAHRLAYEFLIGPIPEGFTIDHLCRVRNCVNPAHLEPVTNAENVRRGIGPSATNAKKTHCQKGHPLVPGNLAPNQLRVGKRACRECLNAKSRKTDRRGRRGDGWDGADPLATATTEAPTA